MLLWCLGLNKHALAGALEVLLWQKRQGFIVYEPPVDALQGIAIVLVSVP